MMNAAELQEVRATPLFAELTDAQIDCILPGEVVQLPVGTVLATEGESAALFFVVLEGEVRLHRTYDRQSIMMGSIQPGAYTGETTLLLDIPWLATASVSRPARLFRLVEDDFWRMVTMCRGVARKIFRSAAGKVRNMESYSQHREKLASLGTMAAGLAHELNNPAAAACRASSHLQEAALRMEFHLGNLTRSLEPEDWSQLLAASQDAQGRMTLAPALDQLDRSDRSEALAIWLESHGLGSAYEAAPTFVCAGLDSEWLEGFLPTIPVGSRADALGWLEARIQSASLLHQIQQSTGRIGELVKAVKSYSYVDQSPVQEVDIHEGLENTLTILAHKLQHVTLVRSFDSRVPRILAYGSELNQVWTNLIDNAIYAVEGNGRICISTSLEGDHLVVEIVDNGCGIPAEVQPRLFDPFFTTKPVGSGTGLGLIISNRIVADRHGGEIEFSSRSGETRFKVRLPIKCESSGIR